MEKDEVPVPHWPLQLVTVKLLNGDKIYLNAHHYETLISEIKTMIESQAGISMKENCLVYVGKVMDEGLTLNDYDARTHCHTIDVHSKGDPGK